MRQLVRYFALDFTASDVAHLTGLTRKSVTSIFLRILLFGNYLLTEEEKAVLQEIRSRL
jgi:hypothetical protein